MILRTYDVTFTLRGDDCAITLARAVVSYRVQAASRGKAIAAARIVHVTNGGDVRTIDGISAIGHMRSRT